MGSKVEWPHPVLSGSVCREFKEAKTLRPMLEEQGTPLMTNRSWTAGYNEKGELYLLRVHRANVLRIDQVEYMYSTLYL